MYEKKIQMSESAILNHNSKAKKSNLNCLTAKYIKHLKIE